MASRILIADDSLVDRRIIKMIINQNISDVEIIELDCGEYVIQNAIQNDIDVCILDLTLTDLNGVEILAALKSNATTLDIPVLVYSGNSEHDTIGKVLELGAYDYFLKPLSELEMKISLPLKVMNAIELKRRTRHIVHLSQTDHLTGLFNRHYFRESLISVINADSYPLSFIMFDINGLKIINDAYGSEIGDKYLIFLGNLIRHFIDKNSFASRWGGDEFAVCLLGYDKIMSDEFAKDVSKQFSEYAMNGLHLSVAYGCHTILELDCETNRIITIAEDAMNRAKILEDISIRSNMIGTIIKTLHEKNPREEEHSRRVSDICERIGVSIGMSEKEVHEMKVVGLLHDIGKIAIDEAILNKPGHLTNEEWQEMKRHPEIGYRLLNSTKDLKVYAEIVLAHHERIDGKGYPNGTRGEMIPLQSRILSIADSYDAMTCERTYKRTMTEHEACKELVKHSDRQFDRYLARVFIEKTIGLDYISLLEEVRDEEVILSN